ncbi:uncharacterized protein LOC113347402 isoform X1 [Papaver somniferum]|uniref:uncharacterized protein LOC113347402 isoform X1 n=1 Tax=Papaver somniferum TaxID=3469 RepID=UPI000E6F9EED|nr:uncharacterized protein LOC113347402 isoform X1 [Papaver somniferum]
MDEGAGLHSSVPGTMNISEQNPKFSFGRIYSFGDQVDIGAALGMASEFRLLYPNDDWEVTSEDDGEKAPNEEESSDGKDVERRAAKESKGKGPSLVEIPLGIMMKEMLMKETLLVLSSENFVAAVKGGGDDETFQWLKKMGLMNVPHASPEVPGERPFDAFNSQWMQLSSRERVAEVWEHDMGVTASSLLDNPHTYISDMMAIDDGHRYSFPQQRFLELVKSEYCDNTFYQFFKAKALKLESKLRQRDDELESAEESIGAKDKEIQELKENLKEKEQAGPAEEQIHQEVASLRGDLEKARAETSSSIAGVPEN